MQEKPVCQMWRLLYYTLWPSAATAQPTSDARGLDPRERAQTPKLERKDGRSLEVDNTYR